MADDSAAPSGPEPTSSPLSPCPPPMRPAGPEMTIPSGIPGGARVETLPPGQPLWLGPPAMPGVLWRGPQEPSAVPVHIPTGYPAQTAPQFVAAPTPVPTQAELMRLKAAQLVAGSAAAGQLLQDRDRKVAALRAATPPAGQIPATSPPQRQQPALAPATKVLGILSGPDFWAGVRKQLSPQETSSQQVSRSPGYSEAPTSPQPVTLRPSMAVRAVVGGTPPAVARPARPLRMHEMGVNYIGMEPFTRVLPHSLSGFWRTPMSSDATRPTIGSSVRGEPPSSSPPPPPPVSVTVRGPLGPGDPSGAAARNNRYVGNAADSNEYFYVYEISASGPVELVQHVHFAAMITCELGFVAAVEKDYWEVWVLNKPPYKTIDIHAVGADHPVFGDPTGKTPPSPSLLDELRSEVDKLRKAHPAKACRLPQCLTYNITYVHSFELAQGYHVSAGAFVHPPDSFDHPFDEGSALASDLRNAMAGNDLKFSHDLWIIPGMDPDNEEKKPPSSSVWFDPGAKPLSVTHGGTFTFVAGTPSLGGQPQGAQYR